MTQQGPLVMGIDLGTACSCVGVWRNGVVEIVPNDQGNRTTPSCVAFNDQERLIGEGAKNQVARNASNTVFDVKRLMGRSFSDASVQSDAKYWPFGVSEGPHPYDKPLIMVSYLGEEKGFSPEEISAMLLAKMKETAEAYVGVPITDAVITVPAYFNGSQRQATKDAGYIAGLNIMRIINEPTAAAIAYSVSGKMRESSTVLVYDLGGGTLDVSLFQVEQGVLRVIATAGDTHLGGEDFTNNMVDHFVNDFMSKNQVDMSGDKKALGRLRRSCEEAKKLSTNPRIPVEVDALFQGIDFHSDITRDEFEELNVDVFRRCEEAIARCLMDANMGSNKVDDVVLVGGSTRIPRVQQLVREFFGGKEPCRSINADEAVAYGATFQAGMLIIRRGENHPCRQLPAVIDITPFSQGIRMVEGLMCVVVPRNAGIPTEITTMEFTTTEDNQSSFDTVYEGDGDITAAGGGALAKKFHRPCVLASAPKGVPKIKVVFFMNPHGIMEVWAQDEAGNKTMMNEVGRFSTEEIQRMEEDAHTYKALDEEHSKNVQARNDIENMLYTMRNAIKQLRDSAERLLLPPPPPEASSGEKEKEPTTKKPLLQTPSSKWRLVNLNKLMKGRNSDVKDTLRKLQEGIKILQETADGTADWLKNNELTTTEIIAQKKHIEDVYQRNVQ